MTTLREVEQARDALLARVTAVLMEDTRVNAAWLSGSYGRGEADAWSDLDLHVAVDDAHYAAFADEHAALFARCGEQILVISHGIRSWSMPNGRFWLVQYAPFMLEIDWNIGPTTDTTIPEASLVLFDRVGIPTTPPPLPVDEATRRAVAKEEVDFFWAMMPIAIKFVGRGHTRKAVNHVELLRDAWYGVWRALYRPELLQKDAYHQNRPLEAALDELMPRFGPVIDPLSALAVLRAYCQEVERLHPALAQLGVTVNDAVVRETYALAAVAEAAALAGGSAPHTGSRR